jgi:integrase/recombinase XerD
VLSEEEVRRLLWASGNIKHRCIMFLLYSAGMRISELLQLKWEDIDEDRMIIYIRGGKDRITLLALDYLKHYRSLYKPVEWSSRTTGRYAHVTKRGFDKLISPLDHIGEGFNLGENKGI